MSLTAAQLELRRTAIGASEAAAAIGLSDFGKGPLDVWASKMFPPPEDTAPSVKAAMGTRLERLLGELYTERTGRRVRRYQKSIRSKQWPFLVATPDLSVPGEERLVETKNTGERMADLWGATDAEEVPSDYWVQAQVQMLVTGRRAVDIAVLIGGWDFRVYPIAWNERAALELVEQLRAFHERHIVAGEQPAVTGSAAAGDILRRRYPGALGPVKDASPAQVELIETWAALRAERLKLELNEEELAARVMAEIGDASGLRWSGGRVTWTAGEKGRVSWKEVAEAAGATTDLIEKHRAPPARTLRFSLAKKER